MFKLDININCRHLYYVFLLVRVTYVTLFYEIADYNCIDCILYKKHVPTLKCAIKIPILMMNFNFSIFKSIYYL